MPPELVSTLKEQRRKTKNGEIAASLFVVPSGNGELCTANSVKRLLEIVERREDTDESPSGAHFCKRVLSFHCTPHLLRHTYITALCASGLDIKKIQYLAGHETAQITLDIYAKAVGNKPEDIYEAIKGIYKPLNESAKSEQP